MTNRNKNKVLKGVKGGNPFLEAKDLCLQMIALQTSGTGLNVKFDV
jgi:hypothetical protein